MRKSFKAGHGIKLTKELKAGLPKAMVPDDVEIFDEDAPEVEESEYSISDKWSDDPSYADQLTKYPQTVKILPPTYVVFDLAKTEDVALLNSLSEKQDLNQEAPRVLLEIMEKQFCDSTANWKLFAKYSKLKYRVLIKKS